MEGGTVKLVKFDEIIKPLMGKYHPGHTFTSVKAIKEFVPKDVVQALREGNGAGVSVPPGFAKELIKTVAEKQLAASEKSIAVLKALSSFI